MILIRNTFVAKPGCASKLAAQIKDAMATAQMPSFRVMTDVTGDFNQVILEHEAANMGEFEARLQEYMTNADLREKMKGYTDHWQTGKREIFQIL